MWCVALRYGYKDLDFAEVLIELDRHTVHPVAEICPAFKLDFSAVFLRPREGHFFDIRYPEVCAWFIHLRLNSGYYPGWCRHQVRVIFSTPFHSTPLFVGFAEIDSTPTLSLSGRLSDLVVTTR
ncbi:hypothetical protein B0H11DRAFT_1928903 [Mycena galericulata]|nr:hypothetical protein B0H11DRAFT_1928903 [Mycena galericulata]